jgi:ribokinase
LTNDVLEELQHFLSKDIAEISVVLMPDFFLDRILSMNCDLTTFTRQLQNVTRKKGGSIDRIKQTDIRGGNAVNTAFALANLGVKTVPIICTDEFGLKLLRFYLKKERIDLSHVKISSKPSITTALELESKEGKINVMLRDIGALANFGPQHFDDHDFATVEDADYVCIFNWAGTRQFGTELAQTVFKRTKTRGKGKTYFDTADPTPNKAKIDELIRTLQSKEVDILSVNENEAISFAVELAKKPSRDEKIKASDGLAMKSASFLASKISARVDLHATNFSATFGRKEKTIAPSFDVPVRRVTGAGDAWNAGNILGDACRLSETCRLTLANAVAAYYIASQNGEHPTRRDLEGFLRTMKKKQLNSFKRTDH